MSKDIMLLVGNGFDIGTLLKFGNGITSSYQNFYNYFTYRFPWKEDNYILKAMKEAHNRGEKDWSDIEKIIETFFNPRFNTANEIEVLTKDLSDVQFAFSNFLNQLVTDNVLADVSNFCHINKLASRTFKYFLSDLSDQQYINFKYPSYVDNHDKINFSIVNFNYTSLLDNYLYLDSSQFDPMPYNYSQNNFIIELNPNSYAHSCYHFHNPYVHINTALYHPHGYQDIPKSLLFGSEVNDHSLPNIDANDNRKFFIKSVCAQSEDKYKHLFEDTKLFIIYGCSIGASDSWWWCNILKRLSEDENYAELIIYNWGNQNENDIKDMFIKNCCITSSPEITTEQRSEILARAKSHIFVINYGPDSHNQISFLQYLEQ